MKNKYIFIPADSSVPCSFIDLPDSGNDLNVNFFNNKVHELIDCDIYEAVYINSDLIMLVDECSYLKDGIPVNPRASQFYKGTMYGHPILGDAIMCSIREVISDLDGELICEHDFGPLNEIYSAVLADVLEIPVA